jgi:hypothetical protein
MTEDEIPLNCEERGCQAEFSAFCLQPDRFSPTSGTRYGQVSSDSIILTGHKIGGGVVTLDARESLTFESVRSHVAMRISVSHETMDRLRLSRVVVVVKAITAILPSGGKREIDEWRAGEERLLTRPLRELGARIIGHNGDRMTAARFTNRIINTLPADRASNPADVRALVARPDAALDPDAMAPGTLLATRSILARMRWLRTVIWTCAGVCSAGTTT